MTQKEEFALVLYIGLSVAGGVWGAALYMLAEWLLK